MQFTEDNRKEIMMALSTASVSIFDAEEKSKTLRLMNLVAKYGVIACIPELERYCLDVFEHYGNTSEKYPTEEFGNFILNVMDDQLLYGLSVFTKLVNKISDQQEFSMEDDDGTTIEYGYYFGDSILVTYNFRTRLVTVDYNSMVALSFGVGSPFVAILYELFDITRED